MSANVGFLWVQLVIRLFLPIVIGIVSSSAEQLPPMEANQNHMEAGVVRVAALFLTSAAGIVVCARAVRHTRIGSSRKERLL